MQHFNKEEVGLRIKRLRRGNGMTQQQLAEVLCYTTERQLQRIENGETTCPIDRLMEIAQIFRVPTDYLLFGGGLAGNIKYQMLVFVENEIV